MSSIAKDKYIRTLLLGTVYDPRVTNAAFVFWHSSIPVEDAVKYIDNLQKKFALGDPSYMNRSKDHKPPEMA